MGDSGNVTPGNPPEHHFAVQIDTTLLRLESGSSHGFQRFAHSFNRTVVTLVIYSTSDKDIACYTMVIFSFKKGDDRERSRYTSYPSAGFSKKKH